MFYNILVFLGFVCYLPKIAFRTFRQKGYRYPFSERLGLKLPKKINTSKKVVWFHANSLGETKAALGFAQYFKAQNPNSYLVFSSVTETGKDCALKSPVPDLVITLPLDFSFVMKKLLSKLQPKMLFIVETDFWYQLFKQAKSESVKIFVISGKVSERSAKRYRKLSTFTKKLFSHVDFFTLQNREYLNLFQSFQIPEAKLAVTGNLKCAQTIRTYHIRELDGFRNILKIQPEDKVITLASTHKPEESLLLKELDLDKYKVLVAPRHPERFDEVFEELSKTYSLARLSKPSSIKPETRLVLIDGMGLVPMLYQISQLAIVGGSFIDKIGGHNVLEPLFFHTPTLFGPCMFGQKDLRDYALNSSIAQQIQTSDLKQKVEELIGKSPDKPLSSTSVLEDTYQALEKFF